MLYMKVSCYSQTYALFKYLSKVSTDIFQYPAFMRRTQCARHGREILDIAKHICLSHSRCEVMFSLLCHAEQNQISVLLDKESQAGILLHDGHGGLFSHSPDIQIQELVTVLIWGARTGPGRFALLHYLNIQYINPALILKATTL